MKKSQDRAEQVKKSQGAGSPPEKGGKKLMRGATREESSKVLSKGPNIEKVTLTKYKSTTNAL